MKKILTLLLTLLVVPMAFGVTHRVQIGDLYYILDETNKTAEVTYEKYEDLTNYQYLSGVVSIPESVVYDGITYSVTEIGDYAFYRCRSLSSVTIGNSVTEIGAYAFYSCSGLTSVIIPNSVTSIRFLAFSWCRGLTSVTIGNAVTEIGVGAFEYCTGLTSVTIPNSVTSIGGWAFQYCSNLTSVTIPNSVTSIGEMAFEGCTSLTSVIIPPSVTYIGDSVFDACRNLIKSTYPNTISNPFNYGISIRYPAKDSEFEDGIIYGKNRSVIYFVPMDIVGTFEIPNTITSIEKGAFGYCSSLTTVNFPSSLTYLGDGSFYNCENLKTIRFNSDKPLTLEDDAFKYCNSLFEIYCNTARPPVSDDYSVFENSVYSNAQLYVPQKDLSLYYFMTPWSKFFNITGLDSFPEESGVENIVVDTQESEDAPYYNLNGQIVKNPTPGIYIRNGKKILVK